MSLIPINIDEHYISDNFDDLNLYNIMVIYHVGEYWKMIKFKKIIKYGLLYDIYQKTQITLCVCPITYLSLTFDGIYKFDHYENYSLILSNDRNFVNIVDIIKSQVLHKRHEVYICNLRAALILFPDIKYVKIKKESISKQKISEYSIVYILIYKSKKHATIKYLLFKSKNNDISKINTYISHKSYYKDGFIISILENMVNIFFTKIKKINIE